MMVQIDVCTDDGWHQFVADVEPEMVESCYQLPPKANRSWWWRWVTGLDIPNGRSLIWQVVPTEPEKGQ